MTKWEYAVEDIDPYHDGTEQLDNWGKDGWELISVVALARTLRFYLKRPLTT